MWVMTFTWQRKSVSWPVVALPGALDMSILHAFEVSGEMGTRLTMTDALTHCPGGTVTIWFTV